MKTLPLYQVDVCAGRLFAGNPAAVCPLREWLPDEVMQAIAAENNLAETAFFAPDTTGEADYLLRWFTPLVEIELCGHATLASGYVLLQMMGVAKSTLRFRTLKAGVLTVTRANGALWLDLPARMPEPAANVPDALARGLGAKPLEVLEHAGGKLMALFASGEDVAALKPDFALLRELPHGVIVTAPGRHADEDFVSRFFAPAYGIDEDPVTGSAHCLLAPYWGQRLGKTALKAAQLSARGGQIDCRVEGERVLFSGAVQPYLKGEIFLPD